MIALTAHMDYLKCLGWGMGGLGDGVFILAHLKFSVSFNTIDYGILLDNAL